MNDRLKFRVYLPDENRYMHNTDCPVIDSSGKLMWCYLTPFGHWEHYPMENAVVEQCTGLKDKNGNLIYEGDVLKGFMHSTGATLGKTKEHIFQVEYWGAANGFHLCFFKPFPENREYMFFPLFQDCEIIGNIHEMEVTK